MMVLLLPRFANSLPPLGVAAALLLLLPGEGTSGLTLRLRLLSSPRSCLLCLDSLAAAAAAAEALASYSSASA